MRGYRVMKNKLYCNALLGKSRKIFLLVLLLPLLVACTDSPESAAQKPELLLYCGITMAHPMREIASIVEKDKNVKIVLTQGGSEDLYQSLATSQLGDLYLPGSASYRKQHLEEGLLGDFVHIGYNQIAMIVKKGNPQKITNDLQQLLRKDINVVIGNKKTGSIGRESKRVLDQAGIYNEVLNNALFLTTDSRNLNFALREGEADLILNWRATAFFTVNKDHMDALSLDPKVAKPKKLVLSQLKFSKHPEIGRYFMNVAASETGQAIFRKYGFLDNSKDY